MSSNFDLLAQRATLALERIADLLEALAAPEPDYEEGSSEPEDSQPDEPGEWAPISTTPTWVPTAGAWARLEEPGAYGTSVLVKWIFDSEGETWAQVVDHKSRSLTVPVASLSAPAVNR